MKGYKERKNMSAVKTFVLAEAVGLALSLLLLAVLVFLIGWELLQESSSAYVVHVIRSVGVFVTAVIAGKRIGSRYALVCATALCVNMLILIGITVLLFDGSFDGLIAGMIGSILGVVAACTICMMQKGRGVKRKRVL